MTTFLVSGLKFKFAQWIITFKIYNHIGIERTQIVSKVNYTRFALCFDPSALQANPNLVQHVGGPSVLSTAQTTFMASTTQKDPKKQSMHQNVQH
jgi:hypothetical protein